jgi:hypothetical protein
LKIFLLSIRKSFGGVYKVIKDGSRLGGKGVLKKSCGQSRMANYAMQSISY